ncbi:MAG: hypothetical protein JW774_08865, partial [Candidatus Aureabacteria bacterium]|nr:hypothetical protein [Candidatus Auribacterota bacterium]
YYLSITKRNLAVWSHDADFIKKDLEQILNQGDKNIIDCLKAYAWATSFEECYPVESRYPFMHAVMMLDPSMQQKLAEVVQRLRKEQAPEYHLPLINSLDLHFNEDAREEWLDRVCPHLKDVEIYDLTPEFSEVSGGLGRVEQYHITWMRRLKANVISFEPKYQFVKNTKKNKKEDPDELPADYTQASYPIENMQTVDEFTMKFGRRGQEQEIGIKIEQEYKEGAPFPRLLISDTTFPYGYSFCRKMYNYSKIDGRASLYRQDYEGAAPPLPTNIQFSTFLAKAQWEYIKRIQWKKFKEQGAKWKPPIINTNDAQTLLASVFRLTDLIETMEELGRTDPLLQKDKYQELEEKARFYRGFMFSGTTHTYKNRGFFGELKSYNDAREVLLNIGIREDLHWLFGTPPLTPQESELPNVNGDVRFNHTSAGLLCSDVAKAVSALHSKEVLEWDPALKRLYGITNGDIIENSTKYFTEYLKELQDSGEIPKDEKYPNLSPASVNKIKKLAKQKATHAGESLGLDANKMTVGYIGRWVDEKRGRRAFNFLDAKGNLIKDDSNNIINLVKNGVQVVIFGNVQSYEESKILMRKMQELEEYINKTLIPHWTRTGERQPNQIGKFIYKPYWALEDQLKLMPALDIQIQDSDRSTGASEYTESNATANGALSMGPPYHEGIIQKHGVPVNFNTLGKGNLLVPKDEDPGSYYDLIMDVKKMHDLKMDGSTALATYQSTSVRLSQVLDARHTAAEYLRLWEDYYDPESPNYYLNKPLPQPANKEAHARIEDIIVTAKTKGRTTPNNNGLEFFIGDVVTVNLSCFNHVNGMKAYLLGKDGKKIYFDQIEGPPAEKGNFYPLRIPTDISGEYEIIVTSGYHLVKYPKKIIVREHTKEIWFIREDECRDDRHALSFTVRIPKSRGRVAHLTFEGIGPNAVEKWQGNLPQGIKIKTNDITITRDNNPANVVDILMDTSPDATDEYVFDVEIPKVNGQLIAVKLFFDTADLRPEKAKELMQLLQLGRLLTVNDITQREAHWHDNNKKDYCIFLLEFTESQIFRGAPPYSYLRPIRAAS